MALFAILPLAAKRSALGLDSMRFSRYCTFLLLAPAIGWARFMTMSEGWRARNFARGLTVLLVVAPVLDLSHSYRYLIEMLIHRADQQVKSRFEGIGTVAPDIKEDKNVFHPAANPELTRSEAHQIKSFFSRF